MSHHSDWPGLDPKTARIAEGKQKLLDTFLREQLKNNVGATGQFPEGKVAPHDQGEIAFAVGVKNGKVIVEFGKEVSSLGMNPQQAIELAQSLLQKAAHASGDAFTMTIGELS